MNIGKNLHDAVHALRLETAVRTLWADTLCINQRDLEERSNQGLMVFTYTRAVRPNWPITRYRTTEYANFAE
jgi:hypothetical protein